VKKKQEAQENYDDAIASGHGAYLLEQVSPDVFKGNVTDI
jgi:hypothetical protein